MTRRIRVEFAGATYHVVSRGNRRAEVFGSGEEYASYLEDLATLARECRVLVLAFCLMPNHPHLCLRTTRGGVALSAFMQRLNLRHALRFNRLNRVNGHLNECRYRAQVVESERYLLTLVRYIHQNPVRAGLAERPEDWPFSSHRAYLGRAWPWVWTDEVLERAGGMEGYARVIAESLDPDERAEFEPTRGGGRKPVVGQSLVAWGPRQVSPWKIRRPDRPALEFGAEVAARLGLRLEQLAQLKRSGLAYEMRREFARAMRDEGYPLHEIGRLIGREEPAVSKMLARGVRSAEEEAEYGGLLGVASWAGTRGAPGGSPTAGRPFAAASMA